LFSMSSISPEYPSRGIRRTFGLLSAKTDVGIIEKHNKTEKHIAIPTKIATGIVILFILLPPFNAEVCRIVLLKGFGSKAPIRR